MWSVRNRRAVARTYRKASVVAVAMATLGGGFGHVTGAQAAASATLRAPFARATSGGYCQVGALPAVCEATGGANSATGAVSMTAAVSAATAGAGLRVHEAGIVATHQLQTPARAIDYQVKVLVDAATARDLTTARTGDAFVSLGVDVAHPACVGQCGYYGLTWDGPSYLATDFDGIGVSQRLFSPLAARPGQTATSNRTITISFRYQRHDGAQLPAAIVPVHALVRGVAAVGNYEPTPIGGVPVWLPDRGSSSAEAKVTLQSVTVTPVS